jgi:hypothetical protein
MLNTDVFVEPAVYPSPFCLKLKEALLVATIGGVYRPHTIGPASTIFLSNT